MKVIIPMAGTGTRFVQAGYTDPKPLIKANGKRIINYILDSFDEDDEFVFICNDVHLSTTNMREVLLELCPTAEIVSMPVHKHGPVHTVKAAYEFIKDDEPIIISYCDNPHMWDYDDFKKYVKDEDLDGCILTHTGFHPHTLSNTKMAFLKTKDGLLEEIKEKECYTDDPMGEHASTGLYYFRRGSDVKKYFDQAVAEEVTYNGEYYVTLVYNLLVGDNLRVGYYATPFVTVFGTPEELENFNAWSFVLGGTQVSSSKESTLCYNYWRQYHEKNIR